MGYTFSGVASDSSSGNVSSVTLNIGPTPSPFVVVAADIQSGGIAPTSLTVGGVALHLDANDASQLQFIYSGTVTGLSGNQTVTWTVAGSSFFIRAYSLWYTSDNISLSTTGSQDSGLGAALGISVAAGNYMFASARLGGTAIFTATVAPNGQRVTGGAVNDSSADWAILANNPSFSITNSQGNAWNAVAATYAVASSAAAFSYISASYIQ